MKSMNLNRLKWLTAVVVCGFLLIFEIARHFIWPELLHSFPLYIISLVIVYFVIILFNQQIFRLLELMQRNLQQQTNYVNLLIESSGNAIITTSHDGKILSWNHAAETIYCWNREEAIGQVLPMVPAELRAEGFNLLERMWRGETISNFETQRLRKDGAIIPVMVTGSPIRDADGKVVGTLGISTDLRERKRLEGELVTQQRTMAVLQERERLARELHDDLGQILAYVNTQSQAIHELLRQGQTDVADSLVKRLVQVAQDAHADVREYILSLQTNVSPEQRLVPTLRGYARRFSQNTGIVTEVAACDDAAITLAPTTETQLMRIVQEALTNVRKHAAARRVTINVCVDDAKVRVEIADDGSGFDPGQLTGGDGQHFGQQIMRDRAAEIGGSIEVVSAPGQGTRLIIHAPLLREAIPA